MEIDQVNDVEDSYLSICAGMIRLVNLNWLVAEMSIDIRPSGCGQDQAQHALGYPHNDSGGIERWAFEILIVVMGISDVAVSDGR